MKCFQIQKEEETEKKKIKLTKKKKMFTHIPIFLFQEGRQQK